MTGTFQSDTGGTYLSDIAGTFESVTDGTFHSAMTGTFQSDTGGTLIPLLSFQLSDLGVQVIWYEKYEEVPEIIKRIIAPLKYLS